MRTNFRLPRQNGRFLNGEISAASSLWRFPMIQSFRDLQVWQKAMVLAERVYSASEQLPRSETYGLVAQIRRAAVSIPSNIAEGKATGGQGFRRHLKIAMGSEAELRTQIELAYRLKLLNKLEADQLGEQASEVGRMLAALFKALPRD
jgi:four helix bundle protein